MSPPDSQTQNGKKSRENSEVFDSATIIPQPKRIAAVDDNTRKEVHAAKEELLKDVGKNLGNMMNMLKEAFLSRCSELFPKHPCESERAMKDVSSQSQEASVRASESPSAFNQFPSDAVEPAGYKVKLPPTVGGGGKGKGK